MDYAKLMKDFYNGAMGDSPIPVSDLMDLVALIFLFTPFGIANSKTHFNANLAGKCIRRMALEWAGRLTAWWP